MLAARLATAIIGIPLLLGLVWLGGPTFIVVTGLAAAQAADEARRLLVPNCPKLLVATILVSSVSLVLAAGISSSLVLAVLGIAAIALFAESLLPGLATRNAFPWTTGIATVVYAGLPLALLVLLRASPGPPILATLPLGVRSIPLGVGWVCVVFSATWAVDSVAYVIGRAFGTHRFSLRLSPKKTWEGTIAGVAAGTLAFVAWSPAFAWSTFPAVVSGILISIACVLGDLAESSLKRAAGVKDSGRLLPGHGGLLDRIDSLGFSIVVVFFLQGLDQSAQILGR